MSNLATCSYNDGMANTNELLETVLRECGRMAPKPFYPVQVAKEKGLDRAALDAALDSLRQGGLVRLTPWEAGHGQGYTLTSEGEQIVQSPRLLARLAAHGPEPVPVEKPLPGPDAQRAGELSPWQRGEAVRAILSGNGTPYVTLGLILLNVAMFFAGMSIAVNRGVATERYLAGGNQETGIILYTLGSVNRDAMLAGNGWWRGIAYQFLHFGLLHLLLNMLFLYNVGPILETMWRHSRFIFLYLISGIGGATGMLLAHSGGAGASGSLCGIFASMAVFIMWNREHLPPQFVSQSMRQLLLNAIIIVIISTAIPNVSGSGHLGGAIAGAVVSIPLMYTLFGRGWQRWLGWVGVFAVPAACMGIVLASVTDDDRTRLAARIVHDGLAEAIDAYNDYMVDMINEPDLVFENAAKKADARQALTHAHVEVRTAAERLNQLPGFADEAKQASVRKDHDNLVAWAALLKSCAVGLEDKQKWLASRAKIATEANRLLGR